MTHRYRKNYFTGRLRDETGPIGFNGLIQTHPDRLDIPLKRRKPTVWAIWNDLFHEAVPGEFLSKTYRVMVAEGNRHTYLVLTKRPAHMADFLFDETVPDNIWSGLTVCNQQEADEKIPVFLQVPGKKFLSIEPMLGATILDPYWLKCLGAFECDKRRPDKGKTVCHPDPCPPRISAVILGGETGPGARPMHLDWVRSVRDQCAAAGVPFFFKSWGAYVPTSPQQAVNIIMDKVNKAEHQRVHRLLDGRTHDELPWRKP